MRPYPASLTILGRLGPIQARLAVPGGKSPTNRALLLAAVARGTSRLSGLLDSDDANACLGALSSLGVAVDRDRTAGLAAVQGCHGRFPACGGAISIGSAGTVGRFLPGLLAAAPEGDWTLHASEQLSVRPFQPLLEALGRWGGRLESTVPGRSFPLRALGGGLSGGTLTISAAKSSQFASGILLASPLARSPSDVIVTDAGADEAYFGLTLDLMRAFGAAAEETPAGGGAPAGARRFRVQAGGYRACDYAVPADANTANYFFALACILGGSTTVTNLDPRCAVPGFAFLEIMERMGAEVERGVPGGGVRVAAAGARTRKLRGGFSLDMRALAESAPTLAVLACFADAPVEMRNLAHIRGHESDRLGALAELTRSWGAEAEEFPDGLRVAPPKEFRFVEIDPRDDHRLAMASTLAALGGKGAVIRNPGCVAKTCPDFFERLAKF